MTLDILLGGLFATISMLSIIGGLERAIFGHRWLGLSLVAAGASGLYGHAWWAGVL